MEILKKSNLKLSSIKIDYNEVTKKKIPHFKNNWLNEPEYINPKHNGFYIKTGKLNKIIVIDIDDLTLLHNIELCNLINLKCKTLSEKTKKGMHYYFKYNKYFESSCDSNLKIDILSDGKCVFCAPTIIKTKKEDIKYTICEDLPINELHKDVIEYLTILKAKKVIKEESKNKKESKITKIDYLKKYFITEFEYKQKLNKLDNEYLNNYDKWLIILSITKNFNNDKLYNVFDEWCKKSKKYNRDNNKKLYNINKGIININYLNNIFEEKLIKTHQNLNINMNIDKEIMQEIINMRYLNLDYEKLKNYNSIIIESDCGTGKTYSLTRLINKLMNDNKELHLISLVSLITLANQHVKSLNDNHINLISYKDFDRINIMQYNNENIVCCINSLLLMKDYDFSNTILYIDEINYFIQSVVNNTTIVELRLIYLLLMKMIRTCKYLILSDATIHMNVFDLCESRNNNKKIFIKNNHKTNENKKAIQCLNENDFFNLMKEDILNNKYHLCASDSVNKITELYTNNLQYGNKEDFIIKTSDNNFEINNADEDFKNKFVYYSPSITTGVDFNNENEQNVYIYITGVSISPMSIFQQLNRTRKINKLYFYINPSIKHESIKYNSLEETKEYFKNAINNFKSIEILNPCFNVDDESKIIENSFFKLFCFNEYVSNIYDNNKESYFKMILEQKGFIIKILGEHEKINDSLKYEIKEKMKEIKDEKLINYLEDNEAPEFEDYEKRRKILNLDINNIDLIEEYKDYITDKFKFEEHLNIMNYFKPDEQIDNAIKKLKENKYNELIYDNKYVKIRVMRDAIKKYNIPDSINYGNKKTPIEINDKDYNLLKTTFRIRAKDKPDTTYEFNKMHMNMVKNIAPIIKSSYKGKEKLRIYEYDNELIKINKKLSEFRKNKIDECLL